MPVVDLLSTFPTEEIQGNLTAVQLDMCKRVRELATKVFEIVRPQLQDFIAKIILCSLVYKTVDKVAKTLVK